MATLELVPNTMADLLNRLGGIPPERIRLRPFPGTATEADVLAALFGPGNRLCELIDGVLVEKKLMYFREGVLSGQLLYRIGNYLETNDLGIVAPGDSQIQFRLGLVRIPDVSFVPWSRIPGDEVPDDPIATVIPTLAVEVLSRRNTPSEIDRKLGEYFEAGVKLAWVIDPRDHMAKVYTSPTRVRTLDESGTLDGGRILPGFKLPLTDLFGALRRRKK